MSVCNYNLIGKSNMNYTKYCNANEILGFMNTFSQNSARKMYENATKLGRFVKLIAEKE